MRHTICIYLAIVFFNVPADCLAQSIDSPNQKNVFKTPPKLSERVAAATALL